MGENIWFVCPEDAPVRNVNERVIAFGRSEQFGAELIRRMIHGMETALNESNAVRFILMEADGILLRAIPETATLFGFHGVVFQNGDKAFRAKTFVHTPWVMDRATMTRVVAAMKGISAESEQGFPDRHIAWACELAGLVVMNDRSLWSSNQIDQPMYLKTAREAVSAGAYALHGVKTERQLEQLLSL